MITMKYLNLIRSTILAGSLALTAVPARAEDMDEAALATALQGVTTTLESGLRVSEQNGRPLSGKFEMDDGRLQLSVYTAKGDDLMEVVINPADSKIISVQGLTDPEDIEAAKQQKSALSNSAGSLTGTLAKVTAQNPTARAVSIVPQLKEGRPTADIMLLKGKAFSMVSQPID
jgi:hypothetical protein